MRVFYLDTAGRARFFPSRFPLGEARMIYSPERTRILNEWIKVLAEFYRGDEAFRA